jgi:Rrf2 family cysteine metabolism transcriptional repressor
MLKLSTKARYAMRAMLELALREGSGPVQLREVARAQRISPKYLEQLAIPLHHAGLVRTERGPSGGYRLARSASAITALDVVQAVEGPLFLLDCLESTKACDRSGACAARGLWGRVTGAIAGVLAETTLTDLRDEQLDITSKQALSYHI